MSTRRETVLVIGASGEIGQAIVRELSRSSYQFILHYNQNRLAIDQLCKNLNEDQLLMKVQADLSQQQDLNQMMMSIPFQVDIIIFAQGQAHYELLTDTKPESIDNLYNTHLKSTMLISKYFLPQMVKNQKGKIIVVSSIWGEIGASNEVVYSTMKGAQLSFVKSLAKEVGRTGVIVNAVSPGIVDTKMNKHLDEEELNEFLSSIPLNRPGSAQDVAKTISFLCSNDSNYIHGQTIRVNGGQL